MLSWIRMRRVASHYHLVTITVTLYTLTSSTTLAVTGVFPPVCRLRREEVLLISRSTNDTTLTLISPSK